nr:MAG: hypothetical protein KatS3mg041_1992 [Bacteroidota bacterium]
MTDLLAGLALVGIIGLCPQAGPPNPDGFLAHLPSGGPARAVEAATSSADLCLWGEGAACGQFSPSASQKDPFVCSPYEGVVSGVRFTPVLFDLLFFGFGPLQVRSGRDPPPGFGGMFQR